MTGLRVVLTSIFAPVVLVAAVVGALAGLAGHFGRHSLVFDLFNHFAPVWLGFGVLGLAGAIVWKGWLRVACLGWGAVAVVATAGLMAPEYLRDTGPRAPAGRPDELKIVQLNSWVNNTKSAAIWTWLDDIKADIVVIEESTPQFRADARSRDDWHTVCDRCEVMILSRTPPVPNSLLRQLGPNPGPATRALFRDRRGEFAVIGVHYAWPTDVADQQSQEQGLLDVIRHAPRARTIVAGDFNSAPWSFSRRRWDAKMGLIRRDRGILTWPAGRSSHLPKWMTAPFLAIDHVYAGEDWATVKVERGPPVGSDHYPVVMTLAPVSRR